MSSRDHARRFHFLREIASGGFGSVYLAKVMHTDGFSRLVAVKLLHQRWSENREIAERMRDEARLLGWLRHRNIVDVIDLTTIGGRVAVVMEYLEAVDLKSVGTALAARREQMSVRAALEVLGFVASALDAAYNRPPYQGEKPLRVIHRDLKPSNLMVDDSGTVKVLDFGVARADFDHRESHTQELQFGSIEYMPPERLYKEPESSASDVYSLGATMYEVIALEKLGKARGRAERHAAHTEVRLGLLRASGRLPEAQADAIITLLAGMLAHDPARRPTAADIVITARALARQTDGEGLMEWAERVVPPLVKQNRDAPRETNQLVDTVLTEDSALLHWGEGTDPGWTDPQVAALIAAQADSPRSRVAEPSMVRLPVLEDGPPPIPPPRAPSVPAPSLPAPIPPAPSPAIVHEDEPEAAATAQFTAEGLARARALSTQSGSDTSLPRKRDPDEDSDAHVVLNRASPTLVFPLHVPEEPVRSRAGRDDDDSGEIEATSPAIGREALLALVRERPGDPRPGETHGDPRSEPRPAEPDVQRRPNAPIVVQRVVRAPPDPSSSDVRPRGLDTEIRARTPEPEAEVEPPPRSGAGRWLGIAFVVLSVLGIGVALMAWGLWTWVVAPAWTARTTPTVAPVAEAAAPTDPDPTAPLPADVIRFASLAPGTSRITITCDGQEASGHTAVDWSGPANACTVRVMLQDRSRLYAEVTAPVAGVYRCFGTSSHTCAP